MVHRAPLLNWIMVPMLGVLGGCVSGQTGSPDCVGTSSCICDSVFSESFAVLVRGSVASVTAPESGNRLTLTVEELVSPQQLTWDIVIGDVIGGLYSSGPSCAPSGYLPMAGDQVLAVYFRGKADSYPGCVEYQRCTSQNCGPQPYPNNSEWDVCDGRCVSNTFDVCLTHRSDALASGDLWLARWEDKIAIGGEYTIAAAEVSRLAIYEQCIERFPAPPAPPCNDTVSRYGCSMVASNPLQEAPWWVLAVALVGAIGTVRRCRSNSVRSRV